MPSALAMQSAVQLPKVNPKPEEWAFVNVSEPGQSKDESLRRIVRSNAMRDYYQKTQKEKKKKSKYKGHQNSSLSIWAQDGDQGGYFTACWHPECAQVHDCMYSSSRKVSSLKQRLGDGGTDPFDSLPMETDRRYKGYLLNDMATVVAPKFLPIAVCKGQHPLIDIWIPHAITDPVLFLATLNFAAVRLDIVYGKRISPRTFSQIGETIRLINLRLNSTKAVSDNTIGAVLMLAVVECLIENDHGPSVHMDALHKMVRMRGGLPKLGWNGVLEMFISWHDLLSSIMMSTPPLFPQNLSHRGIQTEILPSPLACIELGASTKIHIEGTNVLNDIRRLMALLPGTESSIMLSDLISLEEVAISTIHRLLSLKIRKPQQQMHDLDYLYEACRLAALMLLRHAFHGFWPSCPIITQMRSQLKELWLEKESRPIPETSFPVHWGYYTWALVMGGIHSIEKHDKAFFAKRVAVVTQTWRVNGSGGWPEIMGRIKNIGWANLLDDPACDAFGSSVEYYIRSGDGV